ncbi:MAG: diguanylate cyclase [Phyllobacterium sp.]|uniref:sensor domain-containing diguanylate cyclase n=1 Tax=Phyllobacterium sp. TaxID=1871046 RepID=UPI0030F10AD6
MPISKSRNAPFDKSDERGSDRLLQIEAVYDKVPVGLCYVNRHGLFVSTNDQFSRIFGIATENAVGRLVEDVVPNHAALLRDNIKTALAGEPASDAQIEISGELYMVAAAAVTNDLGEFAGISVAYTNITNLNDVAQKLQQVELRTSYALESAGQWIWDLNIATMRVWRSPQYRALLGLDPAGVENESVAWDIVHPDDKGRAIEALDDVVSGRKPRFEATYRVSRPDGGLTWILSRGKVVEYGPDGSPLRLLATSVDITAQKRIEEELSTTVRQRMELEQKLLEANRKLRNQSERDHLTNLPNRRKFNHLLKRAFLRAIENAEQLAVLMVDIDHFKAYNDFYGHLAGDKCLVQVGRALNKVVKQSGGSVARFGGEEFAALISGRALEPAAEIAAAMLDAVSAMGLEHGASPTGRISVSIGMAMVDPAGSAVHLGPEELLNLADGALYESKRHGRARLTIAGTFNN